MGTGIGMLVSLVSVIFVFLGASLAFNDEMFTIKQARDKGEVMGYTKFLPFIGHGGMWGDLIIITPLLGKIAEKYGQGWSSSKVFLAFLIGGIISLILHAFYSQAKTPEAHAHEGYLTPAGYVHLAYMTIALAIFILFYFFTKETSATMVIVVSLGLVAHLIAGTHLVLGYFAPAWTDQTVRNPAAWTTVGALSVLILWRAWTMM